MKHKLFTATTGEVEWYINVTRMTFTMLGAMCALKYKEACTLPRILTHYNLKMFLFGVHTYGPLSRRNVHVNL